MKRAANWSSPAHSQSKRPWGTPVMPGRYNEDGRKKRRCVDCKGVYAPTSGPQKRCEVCRKARAGGNISR